VAASTGSQPLYEQDDQPPGVPPLALTGERTLPDVPAENYWFRRHLAVYEWIAARVRGLRVIDMACGEGYGADMLASVAADVVGVDANPEAHEHARLRYRRPNLRFARDLVETYSAPADAVVFLQTIEHLQDPTAVLEHFRSLVGSAGSAGAVGNVGAVGTVGAAGNVGAVGSVGAAGNVGAANTAGASGAAASAGAANIAESSAAGGSVGTGVVFVSTPNVLTLAPAGAPRSDNPWHVHEYRSAEFERLCRGTFGSVQLYGLFHARKLRIHELALRAGWDSVHARLRLTRPFYDRFTPAIAASDFALRARGEADLDRALDFVAVCRP
jgi:SAM-dependent methyltransferase